MRRILSDILWPKSIKLRWRISFSYSKKNTNLWDDDKGFQNDLYELDIDKDYRPHLFQSISLIYTCANMLSITLAILSIS